MVELSYYWYVLSYFHLLHHYNIKQIVMRLLAVPALLVIYFLQVLYGKNILKKRVITFLLRVLVSKNYKTKTWVYWNKLKMEF